MAPPAEWSEQRPRRARRNAEILRKNLPCSFIRDSLEIDLLPLFQLGQASTPDRRDVDAHVKSPVIWFQFSCNCSTQGSEAHLMTGHANFGPNFCQIEVKAVNVIIVNIDVQESF